VTHRLASPYPPLAAAALAAVLVVAGCGGAEPEDARPRPEGPRLEQQFFDYRLIETEAGERKWVLDADEMRKYTGRDEVELTAVTMDFFRDGAHFSLLTSDSGQANLITHDVHTWGNVVVVTDDGRRLETEELFYGNTTRLITNEVFNRFTRGGDVLTGIGLEATPDLEYIEIKADLQADVGDDTDTRGERP